MSQEHIEDYIGAIYRLRKAPDKPLPLARLQEFFGFSPISIHEMISRLVELDLVIYTPYRGVMLNPRGEKMAAALIRRHRIWERFLTDTLGIPWDSAHELAGQLEHAAPEMVTERLSDFLGTPQSCPHGAPIPPLNENLSSPKISTQKIQRLHEIDLPGHYFVTQVFPETPSNLLFLREQGIRLGDELEFIEANSQAVTLKQQNRMTVIPVNIADAIWVSKETT